MARVKTNPILPHASDAHLREFGFRIHSRPKIGRPLWERAGKLFSEGEAREVTRIERKQQQDAIEETFNG